MSVKIQRSGLLFRCPLQCPLCAISGHSRLQASGLEDWLFKALARCHNMTDSATLTDLEFASLQEVGSSFCHDAIPADHRARLLALGLIYTLLGSVRINTAGRA